MKSSFFTNYSDVKFIDKLKRNIDICQAFYFSVSFIKKPGLRLLAPNIEAALNRGARGQLITSTYQNFTDIDSLQFFYDLQIRFPDRFSCRLDRECFHDFNGNTVGFHSKGYLFEFTDHNELLVGSSNITVYALLKNVEWDVSVIEEGDGETYIAAKEEFDALWKQTLPLSSELIAEYRTRLYYSIERWDMDYDIANAQVKPNYMQRRALKELNRVRAMGATKALVTASAGSGKTFLAAFDALNFGPRRLLYIVHEGSILMKSFETFQRVFGSDRSYGIFNGEYKEQDMDFVFSTNITMANSLELFDKHAWDYIIIDECHHATADTYKKIINYFEPEFLLGITATPERMDGDDVFSLFDQNVPYELRLRDAIINGLVVPFKYYGIRDELIEYGMQATKGHKFVEQFSDAEHCEFISKMIEKHRIPGQKLKALAFCRDISHTGSYNSKLKKALQNALDRLPDENSDNIEYNLFTIAPIKVDGVTRRIKNTQHGFPEDAVRIFNVDEIEKEIQNALEQLEIVPDESITIDEAKNILKYESDDSKGIMCNVSSTSITQLYNKYAGKGLFDLNIRKYIKNKLVDTGINNTLDSDRDNFWFLNNGIIIACDKYSVRGKKVKLSNFSIVNGGQTTTLIGSYKGTNTQEFFIPCKIVSSKIEDPSKTFFTKIAEATNSQKPIYARDLKSNTPEMLRLHRLLLKENIFLEIKRGIKVPKNVTMTMKNEELGQIMLSFVFQRPGTARSNKKQIFESNDIYAQIFKVNYKNTSEQWEFLLDFIDLYRRYEIIESELKADTTMSAIAIEILKNGRQAVFALMGIIYRLQNGDITEGDLANNLNKVKESTFNYGKFLSNYKDNDLDKKLTKIIKETVKIVADIYQISYQNKETTSVSNFLKTDNNYWAKIVTGFSSRLGMMAGQEIMSAKDIFQR